MNELEKTLDVAEIVGTVLREEHVESAVIGAMALAAHGYPRSTEDFDLATCTDPFRQLTIVAKRLASIGYEVELREPDADDSLGGVIDITGAEFLKVQVVNFLNPFNRRAARLAEEAIHSAEAVPSLRARVVTVPYLVAFKLYAGGRRNEGDVIELLERNPQVALDEVREVCARHGLVQGLEPLLRELSRTLPEGGDSIRFSRGAGSRPAPAPTRELLRSTRTPARASAPIRPRAGAPVGP